MSRLFYNLTSFAIVIGFTFVALLSVPTMAAEEGSIARGAKLYDKWFAVIKAEKPKNTHPAWPASNTKKKGNTTWRCKSCHGWDNLGADGAYGSGSYKTGIKGINAMAGADLAKIVAVLKDGTHKLSGLMADKDFQDLALFVSKGQVDMRKYIDYGTKAVIGGDGTRGKDYFDTMCAQCHGVKGDQPKDMKKTLGKQMGNPWEVMHKILNGQPTEQMPALRAINRQVVVDVMAYLETLPKEK
jgi:Cytochrome C oxidase, cbb3-type, subunit III